MSLLDQLKSRFRHRQTDATASYWAAIERAAGADKLSERATNALLDTLETVLPIVGKSTKDVEADVGLMREFHALKDATPSALEDAQRQDEVARAAGLDAERRAKELEAEAGRLREEARKSRGATQREVRVLKERIESQRHLKRQLASAGHRESAAFANEEAREREIESLHGELRNLDNGISSYGEGSEKGRRDAIRTRLGELGATVPDEPNGGRR